VGAFDLYALRQHVAGGSGFGITFDDDDAVWDNAVVRTVTDLQLQLGTWVAWSRKAAEDPALLEALARVREDHPGRGTGPGRAAAGAVTPEPARR
jgi:hypothetical protein